MFGQCLRFVHLGLRSILVLFEKAKMDKEVSVDSVRCCPNISGKDYLPKPQTGY